MSTSKPHSELRERVALCKEQIEASPYSHTIAAGWYAEDVESLLEQLEAVQKALERISFHTFEIATRKRANDALARIPNPAKERL